MTPMGIGEDEQRNGHAFPGVTQIDPDGEPLLLPPEEAAKWKPDESDWTRHLPGSPGEPPTAEAFARAIEERRRLIRQPGTLESD